MEDRRHQAMRRELNEIIRDPQGRVSEAKLFAVLGKVALLWSFVSFTPAILDRWDVLVVIAGFVIAPDIIKKFLTMRAGGGGGAPTKDGSS